MEPPSRTRALRHRRPPSSIDMPTMHRPPSAPPPRAGSPPLPLPLQSAARAPLPCAVYACPPHASLLRAPKDGLGAALTLLGFIADFYAPSARHVVEVDGGYHARRVTADARQIASSPA